MTIDPAPDETERAGDLCAACGHERGEHLPPCEMGISTGRPCGCRQFKVPNETERAELAEAETEHRLREFYLSDPEMAVKDHANTLTVLSECIRKNAKLRAESAHRRDALHHAWAERDRLRVQLAELKAGRAAEATEDPDGDHHYLSTACGHGLHERCRLKCKFCATGCLCSCHRPGTPVGEGRLSLTIVSGEVRSEYQQWNGTVWERVENEAWTRTTPADRGPLTPHPPPWPVDEP